MQKGFDIFQYYFTFLAILLIYSCTTIKTPDITPESINQYKYQQVNNNIHVAVNPIVEPQRSEYIFGVDLLSYGILPVYIIIENQSGTTYLVERKQISLSNKSKKNDTQNDDIPLQVKYLESTTGEEIADLLGSALVVPLAFVINKALTDERGQAIQNMRSCELPDQTLAPKQKVYGFVFFRSGKESSLLNEPFQLLIPLKNIKNMKIENIIVELYK